MIYFKQRVNVFVPEVCFSGAGGVPLMEISLSRVGTSLKSPLTCFLAFPSSFIRSICHSSPQIALNKGSRHWGQPSNSRTWRSSQPPKVLITLLQPSSVILLSMLSSSSHFFLNFPLAPLRLQQGGYLLQTLISSPIRTLIFLSKLSHLLITLSMSRKDADDSLVKS